MYGNMRLINGAGYGYPSYVGFYQNGNFMRVGVINGILRVIETLDVTRAQTQQAQILAQVANQMQVEVPQQQPQQQGTFALNYGPPPQQQPQPAVYQQPAAPNAVAGMLATWGDARVYQRGSQTVDPTVIEEWKLVNGTEQPAMAYNGTDFVKTLLPGDPPFVYPLPLGARNFKAFRIVGSDDEKYVIKDAKDWLLPQCDGNTITFVVDPNPKGK